MGPVRFTFFGTRLEKDRDFSRPYLIGMRLDLKPSTYFEIGFSRVAMFGGGGRKITARTLWEVFTARNENVKGEPGNQLASITMKFIVPWRTQPFTFYTEIGGEDEASGMFSRSAYIAGLYLPRLLSLHTLSARVEYANTKVPNYPRVWYRHHIYTTGYTYEGKIMGHHMGTDAKDLFAEITYFSGRSGDFTVAYDIEKGLLYNVVKSRNEYYSLAWKRVFSDMYEISIDYAYERRKDIDGVDGMDASGHNLFMALSVSF